MTLGNTITSTTYRAKSGLGISPFGPGGAGSPWLRLSSAGARPYRSFLQRAGHCSSVARLVQV